MAPWGDAKLFFCILFITCCCTVTLAQVPMDCCLTVVQNKTLKKALVADYRQQVRGQGCHLDATILVTRRGVSLCVPSNEQWVLDVMKHVDSLKKICKERNYKGNRCFGVRPE